MGFEYERNLPHQCRAIESISGIFEESVCKEPKGEMAHLINPNYQIKQRAIERVQRNNELEERSTKEKIFDICMETGTGKTYTYTKMMYELYKNFKISKFVLIVPSVAIRLGALKFLDSVDTKRHFRDDYGCELEVYELSSQKNRGKKSVFPSAVNDFFNAECKSGIQVLLINHGMLTSSSIEETYDKTLYNHYDNVFEAIGALNAVGIIDEPHRFKEGNKGWEQIKKLGLQMIFRFGATFENRYKNLIYELNAFEAFRQDLVKGIIAEVCEFRDGEREYIRLKKVEKNLAEFWLERGKEKKEFVLQEKDSLSSINEVVDISIEKIGKNKVLLSNGLELREKDRISPYSYNDTLKMDMMKRAVRRHFEIERDFLNREIKIKPLTLFFVDSRDEDYRNRDDGSFIIEFEMCVRACVEELLEEKQSPFYREYLKKTLANLEGVHGGYFSKDNQESDEKIQAQIDEILRDKEKLLSLENIRRFIFSKWTLREGWDNPNVFQICKLRSSGSETSKLQEVGRGLRIPVNEYMARVKSEKFYLHYYVDFSERDFAKKLKNEICKEAKSVYIQENAKKLEPEVIERICAFSEKSENELLEFLDSEGIINRSNEFKEGGLERLKTLFPQVFDNGWLEDKIKDKESKKRVCIKKGKYQELKELWEEINKKAILQYKIESEGEFEKILVAFFEGYEAKSNFEMASKKIDVRDDGVEVVESRRSIESGGGIDTLKYGEFLLELCKTLSLNPITLHKAIAKSGFNLKGILNPSNIKKIQKDFNDFLLEHSFAQSCLDVGYCKVSNKIHPTSFTDSEGNPLPEINPNKIGTKFIQKEPPEAYLFDEIFVDSDFEAEDIQKRIDEVVVFTKIPKESIRIPVVGGRTYSPDFAFVVREKRGSEFLHLVVEAKGKEEIGLSKMEEKKIEFAKRFFGNLKVRFEAQYSGDRLAEIIKKALSKNQSK